MVSTDSPSLHARAAGEVAEVVEQEAMFSFGATTKWLGPAALAVVVFAVLLRFSPAEARECYASLLHHPGEFREHSDVSACPLDTVLEFPALSSPKAE